MLDFKALLSEIGINPTRGRHSSPGWVNLPCPFCSGRKGQHLGFSIKGQFFNCWRCGFHPVIEVISTISGLNFHQAKQLIGKFSTDIINAPKINYHQPKNLELPRGTEPLGTRHRDYLRGRGFDPDKIVGQWPCLGTGALSELPWRIVAPIHYKNRLVSFTSRDITGQARAKYWSCPEKKEVVAHKNIVYGLDNLTNKKAVVVEGVFDAWRLGPGAVATFGIKTKPSQALVIAENVDDAYILFDAKEREAKRRSEILWSQLNAIINCHIIEWQWDAEDPAELSALEAQAIMSELIWERG